MTPTSSVGGARTGEPPNPVPAQNSVPLSLPGGNPRLRGWDCPKQPRASLPVPSSERSHSGDWDHQLPRSDRPLRPGQSASLRI